MANPLENIRNQQVVSAARETERLDKINLRKARESSDRRLGEHAEKLVKEYNLLKQKAKASADKALADKASADKDISEEQRLRERFKSEEHSVDVGMLAQPLEKLDLTILKGSNNPDALRKKVMTDNLVDSRLKSEVDLQQLKSEANAKLGLEVNLKLKSEVNALLNAEASAKLKLEALDANAKLHSDVNAKITEENIKLNSEANAIVTSEANTKKINSEINAKLNSEANARLTSEANTNINSEINTKLVTDNIVQSEKRKQRDNAELQSAILNQGGGAAPNQVAAEKELLANLQGKQQGIMNMPEGETKLASSGPDKQLNYPFKSWQGDPSVNIAVQSDAAVAQASDDRVQRALREHQAGWQHDKPLIIASQNNDQGKGRNAYQPQQNESGDDE